MRSRAHTLFLSALIFLTAFLTSGIAQPQSQPRIFFSDLESGPNTGGQDNKGAFVTIWGKGFGANRANSLVTVGGGAVDSYPVWSDEKITFQLGPRARTGNIVAALGGSASR